MIHRAGTRVIVSNLYDHQVLTLSDDVSTDAGYSLISGTDIDGHHVRTEGRILSKAPEEGVDRCHCGATYWDGPWCHSCKSLFSAPEDDHRGDPVTMKDALAMARADAPQASDVWLKPRATYPGPITLAALKEAWFKGRNFAGFNEKWDAERAWKAFEADARARGVQ